MPDLQSLLELVGFGLQDGDDLCGVQITAVVLNRLQLLLLLLLPVVPSQLC